MPDAFPPFIVRPVASADDWARVRAIREEVFILEQQCPPEEEWDSFDDVSRHLLGLVEGRVVAVARWRTTYYEERAVAKLERFAVVGGHRGRGYGRALVRQVVEDAARAGFDTCLIHAQAHLENFYQSLGFRTVSDLFAEAGIPHVAMVRG